MECCSGELIAVVTLAAFFLYVSHTARYYAKFITFLIASTLFATLLPPLGLLKYPVKDHRIALLPAWACKSMLSLMGLTYEVRGHDNIDRNKGGVVLINHQSGIDLVVLAYLWPILGRATVVAKKAILYAFPFGTGAWLWGTLFIDRTNRNDALNRLNKECDAIEQRANKILMFPEGTRSQEEKLLPFKKGPFHLAIQSQSMIQPVVVSKYHFLDSKNKHFEKGHNIISILPEISCKGLTKDDLPQLIEKTQNLMQAHYEELSKESRRVNPHLTF
ncbi:1-acyl-sn-glycerol-3-phosphate acyltransferase alpha [Bradysia coprophila]|uniref:1-acyl-sn-glycerol-3-phosphate acyltransferase alpha n=1 Tax=Bradysia coprophila TaxID=38358 RepID=UPI00187D8594|nr:1-acyl-sn-glycerol-3-phosphate acyltransferase alpha [Bradysia coprophila]